MDGLNEGGTWRASAIKLERPRSKKGVCRRFFSKGVQEKGSCLPVGETVQGGGNKIWIATQLEGRQKLIKNEVSGSALRCEQDWAANKPKWVVARQRKSAPG